MFLAFSHHRCVCVWPVCDGHFCECWAGGDGQPGTVLPHRLPAQLYRHRVPSQPPVYFQRQHLHREPGGSGASTEILPVQRRLAQRLLSRLCHGKSLTFLPSSIWLISGIGRLWFIARSRSSSSNNMLYRWSDCGANETFLWTTLLPIRYHFCSSNLTWINLFCSPQDLLKILVCSGSALWQLGRYLVYWRSGIYLIRK